MIGNGEDRWSGSRVPKQTGTGVPGSIIKAGGVPGRGGSRGGIKVSPGGVAWNEVAQNRLVRDRKVHCTGSPSDLIALDHEVDFRRDVVLHLARVTPSHPGDRPLSGILVIDSVHETVRPIVEFDLFVSI